MAQFATVAQVSDIPPGQRKVVSVEGVSVLVLNVGGSFYAVDENCPHRGRSLSKARLVGNVLTCPWHLARFDLATGAAVSQRPPTNPLTVHQVRVEGESVLVAINRRG